MSEPEEELYTYLLNISRVRARASGNPNLQRYVRMQCIKRSSTARCSKKRGNRKDKPIPRIVFRYGEQYRKVKWFLETRRFLLDSLKRLKKEVK